MEQIPITQEGYDNLQEDIRRMETVEMPLIAQKIADARAEGDLRENAEYHGQRENQGMLQAKIDRLKSKLALSYIVEPNNASKDSIVFGCTVTLKDIE
ncbi:MAG: transcription elongation factor GreA, partial [Planctomycetes bacterium]|nr:transcription elongation factor GreA [Planctomycetota bacterium]